jgi:hypothetical protein
MMMMLDADCKLNGGVWQFLSTWLSLLSRLKYVSQSVSHITYFQPPRADQMSDSDRQSQHPALQLHTFTERVEYIHKIIMP